MSNVCYPGVNNPRHDVPRIEIGEVYHGYIAKETRFVRTGTFGAGYLEFLMEKVDPIPGRRNEGWVRELTIQNFIEYMNGSK